MKEINWHSLSIEEITQKLKVDLKKGLSEKEAKKRIEKFGKNVISKEKKLTNLKIFISQFKSPLIYILIVAGIITFFLGKKTDTLVILIAVLINTFFGFWEERKTAKVLEKLKKVLKTKATVLRGGVKKEIFKEDLVVGDIIFLRAGDRVPADGRLIESNNLKISEAILTGEWIPAQKRTEILPADTPLADRDNMVYMGCLVEDGEGKAVVVATGKNTETGKIATLIRETKEEKTPLQRKLSHFSKIIGILISLICVFIFLGGVMRGENILEMFETGVAIAVGGIPEALPVMMTVVLAVGMERILRKKGLIRKLSSVETLGSTSIICFDKTRTLTEGKMEIAEIISENEKLALKVAVLCNEAFIENPKDPPERWKIKGSPTDICLLRGGAKRNILKPLLEKKSIEIKKLPFNSVLKYQLSLREEEGKYFLYICGAPEKILEKSTNKGNWEEKLEHFTKKGLRVVGVGIKEVKKENIKKDIKDLAKDFKFEGLIALRDPLRKDVKDAIKICQTAGMKPILVTGDHKLTAKFVANEIGMIVREGEILEGTELDKMSDEELFGILEKIKIFARVEPKHKMRIIKAWQKKGKVVAMTGDGVNDAPALKQADIGIALGSGTDVAKEASDLVLLDDSFSAIVKAIEQGRVILDNLRKSISYILADSFTSVILVGFAKIIFGWPLPILPVQILWNNFVEDTLPDISYAFEPMEEDVMKRKPPSKSSPLLNKEMKVLIFGTGIIDQLIILILFWYLWSRLNLNLEYVRTMVFGAICIDTAFVVYCYKSLRKNIWRINIFSNKLLLLSSLIVFLTFALAVYFPPLQKILHTVPLNFGSWLILIGVAILSMLLIEVTKWYFISRHLIEE